ncbi:MAG: RecQ family ATP-dependent DNA helicase [Clostridiales bacterium]|nr:RecQ family ATP-dependent DNA helicase [Clostridiales bacterium]
MEKLKALKDYFGHTSFRKGQEEIIDAIMEGRDVLGIMPTGSGKSVCYQLPAVMTEGITLVISPLISLMRDQVTALIQAGIPAAYLNSSLTPGQFSKALYRAAAGAYKIIYVAPERLESFEFISFALQADITLVTVDEAHCVSQWGQDFRPSYLKIAEFVKKLNRRPVVAAFTATATTAVKKDIITYLDLETPLKVSTGYNRENLYFGVRKPKDKFGELIKIINEQRGNNGIVYCLTRKTVDKLYDELTAMGINAAKYHAGMTDRERRENQDDFIYDRKNVIVATNAFGMGIDKSDVRYVVHYNMPKDIESYYQEAGRAGRDGEPSDCILLFSPQDIVINKFLIEKSENVSETDPETRYILKKREYDRLNTMEGYCRSTGCLRRYILNYFGEALKDDCGNCSYCKTDFIQKDITAEAETVVKCVDEYRERYGLTIIRDTLKGSKSAKAKKVSASEKESFGAMSEMIMAELNDLLNLLIENEVIKTEGEYPVVKLTDLGREVLRGERKVVVKTERITESVSAAPKKAKPKKSEEKENKKEKIGNSEYMAKKAREIESLPIYEEEGAPAEEAENTFESRLFDELRVLRKRLADRAGVPPYVIFSDKSLDDMCKKLPQNDDEFLAVSGVGQEKLRKYGESFTEAIRSFISGNPTEADSAGSEADDEDFYNILRENIENTAVSEEPASLQVFLKNVFERLGVNPNIKAVRERVYDILTENEAVYTGRDEDGRLFRDITPESEKFGVIMVERFSKDGIRYRNIYFTPKGQRFILNELIKPKAEENEPAEEDETFKPDEITEADEEVQTAETDKKEDDL